MNIKDIKQGSKISFDLELEGVKFSVNTFIDCVTIVNNPIDLDYAILKLDAGEIHYTSVVDESRVLILNHVRIKRLETEVFLEIYEENTDIESKLDSYYDCINNLKIK